MWRRTATQISRSAVRVASRNHALLVSPRFASLPAYKNTSYKRFMATEAKSGAIGHVSLDKICSAKACHATAMLTIFRFGLSLVPSLSRDKNIRPK